MNINDRSNLGKMLKSRRLIIPLTLQELRAKSGVSASHLGRIERGNRFPSAPILRKIAKALDLGESWVLTFAGYLSPQGPTVESEKQIWGGLDPYVASVLASEPTEVQRTAVGILSILKSMSRESCNIEFREYARRKYPELDEDVITMIEDIIKTAKEGRREHGRA